MFKFLTIKDQLRIEQQKNAQLEARNKELEDALIELAEIVATNEEVIKNG